MKLQPSTIIKTFIVLISVVFALTLLTANSRHFRVSSANSPVNIHAKSGADIYARSCARCHGSDGRAQTAKGRQTGATNFTSAKWTPNEARGIRTITNGKGNMPAFKGTLSAEDIRSVWAYVRGFKR
jgi:mono/diheme cytochrome c family protein